MRHLNIITLAAAAVLALASCQEKYITYSGPSYIAFPDTLSICPVQQNGVPFDLVVASTNTSDHDRTFGVEVVASKSNAIYGHHYRLESQTVVIPAGERTANIRVIGNYDNVAADDSLSVTLSLVSAEDENWELYGQQTRILLKKICPFDIHNFEGWCRVTSSFWLQYSSSLDYSRLVKAEVVDDHTVAIKDFLMDDFDITMTFDNSDIINPVITMGDEQIIGDTRVPFNYIYGDGYIRAYEAPIDWSIDICGRFAITYMTLYVKNVGTIGTYVNIIEWLTDEEAAELQ